MSIYPVDWEEFKEDKPYLPEFEKDAQKVLNRFLTGKHDDQFAYIETMNSAKFFLMKLSEKTHEKDFVGILWVILRRYEYHYHIWAKSGRWTECGRLADLITEEDVKEFVRSLGYEAPDFKSMHERA